MSRVCVSVVNGMNWGWESQLGTEGLALDPWLGASAPTSWLDIDDKLFQLQLAKISGCIQHEFMICNVVTGVFWNPLIL